MKYLCTIGLEHVRKAPPVMVPTVDMFGHKTGEANRTEREIQLIRYAIGHILYTDIGKRVYYTPGQGGAQVEKQQQRDNRLNHEQGRIA